jgi:dihydrofolate synthase/folylpolyglutamate synthase
VLTSTPFKTASDVYAWISGFINFERGQDSREFHLEHMRLLTELAGHPEKCAPSIHVAGSKGKGSVTGMIAAILGASGIRTARYASPHVVDFRERISLGNNFFSDDTYVAAGQELYKLVKSFPGKSEALTFFELVSLWFFLCARRESCAAMAVETGLGGRLDATNVLDPLLSVITIIELEHTECLGETVAAIAAEKAGIIKPGRPLVLAGQNSEALEVFREHAARRGSPLIYFPLQAELDNLKVDQSGTYFDLVLKKSGAGTADESFPGLFTPMPGEVQTKNAALAILALRNSFPEIKESAVREALSGFALPARFQRLSVLPPVIIDGAHTVRSVDLTLKTFSSLYGCGGILIFGCAAGKDILSMATLCLPFFSRIIITRPGDFRESFPEKIYEVFVNCAERNKKTPKILYLPQTEEALNMALELGRKDALPILATGSFYLAAEISKRFVRAGSDPEAPF